MKRTILVGTISGILLCAGAMAADNEVLDINGGFEEASSGDGNSGKWRPFGNCKQPVELDTAQVHSGSQALMLTLSDANESGKHYGVESAIDPNLMAAGDVLEFSAFVFQKDVLPPGSGVAISLRVFDSHGQINATTGLKVPNTAGEWLDVVNTLTLPPDFDSGWYVDIVATTLWKNDPPASPIEIYIDDISLTVERNNKAK